MAGGAKETPRQKMIGMMYLVLTALLALQVSNSVLQKFIFIDQSLMHSFNLTSGNNDKQVGAIEEVVKKNKKRPDDVKVMKGAQEVQTLTKELIEYMGEVRENIIQKSGGYVEGSKELAGAKDYDKQMAYTLGPEGKKNGEAYTMQKKINGYIDALMATAEKSKNPKDSTVLKLDYIALDAKEIEEYKNDPDQKSKDFAYLNFDHTPTVACLAIMSQLQTEIVQAEAKALKYLAEKVGAADLKFDKVVAMASPTSKIVAAGTKYEAELFIVASSSSANPKMSSTVAPVKVEDGKGKIEFVAKGGDYDKEGKVTKTWRGSITVKTAFGDTTYTVEEEYIVAKPVIQVQSASVSALYLNCGNELNIQVPALGEAYDPSFTAAGAEVIRGAKKGLVTVVPNKAKVDLNVSSGGNLIGKEKFRVKKIPNPSVVCLAKGKPVDLKNGFSGSLPRSISIKAKAEQGFKEFLPKDARYKVTEWDATLARGKRALVNKKVTSETLSISDMAAKARPGDRIVIEVKRVKRMNFKNKIEDVKMGVEIITIPIN